MAQAPIDALLSEGYSARRAHQPTLALAAFTQAAESARAAGNAESLARALAGIGQIHRDLRDLDLACDFYQQAVDVCRALEQPLHLAHTLRHLADVQRDLGKPWHSRSAYAEARGLYQSQPDAAPLDLANTLRGRALLESECGEADLAIEIWSEARDLYREADVQAGVDEATVQLDRLRPTS